MSPVPDPSQNHSGNSNPLENIHPENQIINVGVNLNDSSSEEEQQGSVFELGGYQPLPQAAEGSEEEIDYQSLSGLLNALHTHGPTEIEATENSSDDLTPNDLAPNTSTSNGIENVRSLESESQPSPSIQSLISESESQARGEDMKIQAAIWNSKKTTDIELSEEKENEIKSVMAKITLPSAAVPSWARELTDEEWRKQVSSRIFGKQCVEVPSNE